MTNEHLGLDRVRFFLLSIQRIALFEFLEDTDFYPTGITIFGYRSDDLDSDPLVVLCVDGFNHLAKGALTKQAHSAI